MHGWTRRQLASKLLSTFGLDISLQTLATYELGTRSIPHVRLVQLALILEINLPEMLDQVFRRLFADDSRASGWDVDLDAASELNDPRLVPLRRWARCRLRDSSAPVPGTTVWLGLPELGDLAVLCDMDTLELAAAAPTARSPAARMTGRPRTRGAYVTRIAVPLLGHGLDDGTSEGLERSA